MSRIKRSKLELKPKTALKTTVKYRLVLSGSALAVAVLFGIGVFMYGNIGNNTESLAANNNKYAKEVKKLLKNTTTPQGPGEVEVTLTSNKVSLSWVNKLEESTDSKTDGILVLRKAGIVSEDQSMEEFETDSSSSAKSFINGWQVLYNGNLVSSFSDSLIASGAFTYLVFEKNNGIKYTAAKNAARAFVFNGTNISETLNKDTRIDGLLIPATCTLEVASKAELEIRDGGILTIAGTFVLGGEIKNEYSKWTIANGGQFIYDRNGNKKSGIPVAKWESGSTCIIQGVTTKEPAGLNQSFENFTWNCKDQSSDITLPGSLTVHGDLTIQSTGKKVKTIWFDDNNVFTGILTVNDGSAKVNAAKNSTITLSGTTTQTIQGTWNFQKVVFDNDVVNQGTITVNKEMVLISGEVKNPTAASFKLADEAMVNCFEGTIKGILTCAGTYDLYYHNPSTTGAELTLSNNALKNLTIDCKGDLTLGSNVSLNGTLQFISGRIVTGKYEVSVKNTSANSIKGYSASSYVVGDLRRSVDGKSTYDFPIGTSAQYELISTNFSKATGFNSVLAHFNASKPDAQSLSDNLRLNGTVIGNMLDYGYWSLTPNTPMTSGTCSVTLNGRGQSNAAPSVACYCVLKRDNATAGWQLAGKHSMKTQFINHGTVTAARSMVPSLGDFAIAYSSASLILSRSSLTASINNNHTDIVWRTNLELDNPTLTVERSIDAYSYEEIGEMKDKGESNDMFEFAFKDSNPLPGTSYYRVRQVDANGTVTYSDIRFVTNNQKTASK